MCYLKNLFTSLTLILLFLCVNSASQAAIVASDLDIFIEKGNTSVQLFQGAEDDSIGDLQLYFAAQSSNPFQGSASFPTNMQPFQSLSAFNGAELSGTWSLSILDDFDPGEGNVLYSWSLFGFLADGSFFYYWGGPEYNVDTNPATTSSLTISDRTGSIMELMVGVNLAEPVETPLPSALILLSSGIIAIIGARRKKR